jgi:hypothetical protein
MSNVQEILKVELPYYDEVFSIVEITGKTVTGKWGGNYVSSYNITLSDSNENRKVLNLNKTDPLLGQLLAFYHRGFKEVSFTTNQDGNVVGVSKGKTGGKGTQK